MKLHYLNFLIKIDDDIILICLFYILLEQT